MVPSSRRHALRKYEQYFHAICWPLPALLAGGVAFLGYLGDAGSWCAVGMVNHSREYLICFYLPLLFAFTFNVMTCRRRPRVSFVPQHCSQPRRSLG